MKKSYHLKTSTLYFLTAENPKELFGKLYPRRIEATEYKLMEMECWDYQEVIGEFDDDHNYWEIIDEVNEGVEFEKFKPYDKEQRKVEEIEVDWLQDISPIYKKFINKNEITSTLQHTLDNEDEYISVFSPNEEDAKNIIDTVIENNGGFSAFESFDYENWHYCYNGYLFNISYKILIPEKLYVVELNRNPKNKMMYFDNSIVLYGIHKDSKKVNNLIKGLNSIVYNAGEMTSGGGQLFNTSDDSNLIVSYWHKLDKLVEKFKSIIDCYPENAFIEDSLGEDKEIKDFTYENIQEIVNHSLWFITFKTEKFRINLSQGNSSYQMNINLT